VSLQRESFLKHLEELRGTLLGVALAWVIGMCVVGVHLASILELLRTPLASLSGVKLITLSPMTGFWIALQVITAGGAIVGTPLALMFILRFITPALTDREQRAGLTLLIIATVCFVAGVALGWGLLLPAALRLALAVQVGLGLELMWEAQAYFGLILTLPMMTGLGLCLPLLVGVLVKMRVLPYRTLIDQWPVAIVVILMVAAAITPTGDPITFLLLGLPMTVLYLLAVRLGKPKGE
jgi:sec-independent protein translocase protein TatC